MNDTKPQKKLVSKGQYVRVMGKKAGLYSLGGIAFIVGLLGFALALFRFTLPLAHGIEKAVIFQPSDLLYLIPLPVSIFIYVSSKVFLRRARAIEPVLPITDRSTDLLPLEETLVRGSDPPPAAQRVELLRAANSDQKAFPEQLLRPTGEPEP